MEKIFQVKVKTNSKIEKIHFLSDNVIEVWLKEKPIKYQANVELINILSKKIGYPAENFKIIKGKRFNQKVIKLSN